MHAIRSSKLREQRGPEAFRQSRSPRCRLNGLVGDDDIAIGEGRAKGVNVVYIVRCPVVICIAMELSLQTHRNVKAGHRVERLSCVLRLRKELAQASPHVPWLL